MGIFSNINRFHEAGEAANENNVERFGAPARSLYTSTKVFSLRQATDITDEADRVVYRAQSKALSLRDKTDIYDAEGGQVAHIERKVLSLHQRHYVTMADGTAFELSNELMHLIKDITNIEGLGWQLRGDILGMSFELYDGDGEIIAVIGQKLLSIHDKFCIDIYRPEHEAAVIAILVALQHMLRDRANASSASSSSGGGN